MNFPVAIITAVASARHEAESARPEAPIVPHTERPRRTRRIRAGLARGLIRAAHAIAPT
ncbi:hypothetical protein GCM10010112_89420 [Actinoplanes lobatus]|uniref:Uncharacterized protein n=1 Tax=Actinoplanes lobatus TaxID=113568 RepID=A0A7W7MJA5_9ACTN|nr:hypothetical protein [Actinoplanes lobatus]MBB4751845.1 hypothetical protein [Actinoplanes lobatus]GGN97301.1 hypothetical protein GCM10010112_89420 [Actinoplanes lobatus]GIE45677.1 hypothetical protein Alo02nite_85750 [Actinoplanes lobatus]